MCSDVGVMYVGVLYGMGLGSSSTYASMICILYGTWRRRGDLGSRIYTYLFLLILCRIQYCVATSLLFLCFCLLYLVEVIFPMVRV